MNKLQKLTPLSDKSSQESQMKESENGKYWYIDEVKRAYHPLLRSLRYLFNHVVAENTRVATSSTGLDATLETEKVVNLSWADVEFSSGSQYSEYVIKRISELLGEDK